MVSNEKRQLLVEALVGELKLFTWEFDMNTTVDERAQIIAERVIAEGWQWHPKATPDNINFNEVTLLKPEPWEKDE